MVRRASSLSHPVEHGTRGACIIDENEQGPRNRPATMTQPKRADILRPWLDAAQIERE